MRRLFSVAVVLTLLVLPSAATAASTAPAPIPVSEFRLPADVMNRLRDDFVTDTLQRYPTGSWAPLKMQLDDRQLALMGLPPADVLASLDLTQPMILHPDGRTQQADPALLTFAGTGWFGIRPGAWLLLISGNSVGWCSAAHVYGAPGSYDISTAGHCGRTGDPVTMIGVVGDNTPILMTIGRFATSHDGGIGNDWALIDIDAAYQHLVTPTMAFWGGPRGMFTSTGAVASVGFKGNNLLRPEVTVTPNPFLAQGIAHYGHGTGIGAGGTPRAGAAIHWGPDHFMFSGAITPGDSGSGSNTTGGDAVGDTMEAAGINTHIYVDAVLRNGIGVLAGTRATKVSGTLANGQIVPYPVPIAGLP